MSGRKWSNLGQPGAGNKKFKKYIYIYIVTNFFMLI